MRIKNVENLKMTNHFDLNGILEFYEMIFEIMNLWHDSGYFGVIRAKILVILVWYSFVNN